MPAGIPSYKVTVRYNSNGGTGSISNTEKTVISDSPNYVNVTVSLANGGYERSGYVLKGWSKTSGGSVQLELGANYTVSFTYNGSDQEYSVILYAVWEPKKYTVSYNANGGSGAPASQTKIHGINLTLSSKSPNRSKYQFMGWATSPNGSVVYHPGGTYSGNSNITLYAVWKSTLSTVSIRSGTIGGSAVIRVTSPVGGTTFTLTYKCGTKSGTIVSNQNGSPTANGYVDYTWTTVPLNLAEEGPNSTFVEVVVYCKTIISGSAIGTTNASRVMTIPNNATFKPTAGLSFEIVNDNATIDGWGIALQGFTKIKLTGTGSAAYGASIASYTFSGPDYSKSSSTSAGSKVVTTGAVIRSGSLTYKVLVTDSRGYTEEASVSVTVYPYTSPAIDTLNVYRSDSNGNENFLNGTRISASAQFSVSSCNGNNHAYAVLKYKATLDANYTLWISDVTSEQLYTLGTDILIASGYDVRCELTDDLGISTFVQMAKVSSVVGYALGLYNDRVRFGGPCQIAGFECDWNARFHGRIFAPDHAQRGFVQPSAMTAGEQKSVTVTFDESFDIAPNVTVTLFSQSGYIGNVSVSVYDTSSTGFKMRIENLNNSSVTVGANWIAIL